MKSMIRFIPIQSHFILRTMNLLNSSERRKDVRSQMKKDCNNEEKKEELYSHPNNDSDCCGNPSICDSFVSCSNSVSKTRI